MPDESPTTTVLYLVPTPIGNLEDITLRAIRILGEVDTVLAEDTRNSGRLMQHLGLKKPLLSYHLHNEHQTVARLIERLEKGERMALVSDAGTPGISDPGFLLVRECLSRGLKVECLPGLLPLCRHCLSRGLGLSGLCLKGFCP